MKRNILLLLLVLYFASYSSGQQEKTLNIALVADKPAGLDKSPLISLLEVRLSQNENIRLLERAGIDEILEEQQLNVTGLFEREIAIKVGKLLRTDAFVLLSVENGRESDAGEAKLLRVRLAETAHGLRLFDSFELLDETKLEDVVQRLSNKIEAATAKLLLPAGQTIPVGIVDIHRVQLGERHKLLERALPVLLSIRLDLEPEIMMLEREDLKILLDEKFLTEGEDTDFWASTVLIDGYLQPKDGGVEMKLSLRRTGGGEIISFAVPLEPNEPSTAIDKVAVEVIKQLRDIPPESRWQPEQEAEEFYRQGQLLSNHQRYEEATTLFETAHALQPKNVYYTGAVFTSQWDFRTKLRSERSRRKPAGRVKNFDTVDCFYSDSDLADIVSILVRQIRDGYEKGSLSKAYVLQEAGRPLGLATDEYGKLSGYFANPASVSTDKIRYINRENRNIWTETVKQAAKNWEGYPMRSKVLTFSAWVSSDDPEELIANLGETFSKLFMSREIGNGCRFMEANWSLIHPRMHTMRTNKLEKTHLKGSAIKFRELWLQYLEDLTKESDPIVRYVGYIALSRHYGIGSYEAKNYDTAKHYCKAAMEVLLKELKSPNEPVGDMYSGDIDKGFIRKAMYYALVESRSMKDPNERIAIFTRIFNPLIEKSDARSVAIWNSAFKGDRLWYDVDDIKVAERYANLLKKIEALLKNPKGGQEMTQLSRTKSHLAMLVRKFPQLQPSQETKKLIAKMLLIKEDWPGRSNTFLFTWVLQQEKMLWIAFAEPGIGLAGIDLTEKKLHSLWQASCPRGTALYENMKGRKLSGSVTGMAICKDACYVAVRDRGLVKFPESLRADRALLTPSRILTEKDGLPSVSITGMVALDDKLWIAYGGLGKESGLIVYNPQTGDFDTIFCSALDGAEPFNTGKSYALSFLTLGPDNKLFFIMGERDFSPGIVYQLCQYWGLWSINTNTRATKFLWRDDNKPMVLEAINISGENWWLQDLYSITQFDPRSEKAKFVLGWTKANYAWQTTILKQTDPMPELQSDLFVPKSSLSQFWWGNLSNGRISLRTAAVFGNTLWARLGRNQLIIMNKGKGYEDAEIIDNNILDGEPVERFVSTPYGLIAIGQGTVGLIETENNSR